MFDNTNVDPNQEIHVGMKASEWQQLLQILQDVQMPYRVSAPLIHKIGSQCMTAANRD